MIGSFCFAPPVSSSGFLDTPSQLIKGDLRVIRLDEGQQVNLIRRLLSERDQCRRLGLPYLQASSRPRRRRTIRTDETSQQARARKLEELGFQKIEGTELFRRGDFLVRIEKSGRYRIFAAHGYKTGFHFVDLANVKAVDWIDEVKNLVLLEKAQEYSHEAKRHYDSWLVHPILERTPAWAAFIGATSEWAKRGDDGHSFSISHYRTDQKFAQRIYDVYQAEWQGRSLADQLLNKGFVEVAPDLFMGHWGEVELYILLQDGVIQEVMRPLPSKVDAEIDQDTLIFNYQERMQATPYGLAMDNDVRARSEITLRTGHLIFVLSPRDSPVLQDSRHVIREMPSKTLGLKPLEAVVERSGFKIGGVNETSLIRTLTRINGVSIRDLEEMMSSDRFSVSGFLGKRESLLAVLAEDNDFVRSRGLTHQEIALHLKYLVALFQHIIPNSSEENHFTFVYHGREYRLGWEFFMGDQGSPFNDGTKASGDMHVTNLKNGKRIFFSLLLPEMIERYGFYEGRGTRYRLDPSQILEVFDFLKES